ncbi:hypothetical protein ACFLVS_05480, partial [Chloroflexota bacterium]
MNKSGSQLAGKVAGNSATDEGGAVAFEQVSRQLSSKPKSVTQGLTSIGFGVESRRLPANNKELRLYAVSDARKWREMVSCYYYSENEDDVPQEAPFVLRSISSEGVAIRGID